MHSSPRRQNSSGRLARRDPLLPRDIDGDLDPISAPLNSPAAIVRAAKASLREPSRPFTPADPSRRLFAMEDFGSARPSSAFGVPSVASFLDPDSPRPASPLLPPLDRSAQGHPDPPALPPLTSSGRTSPGSVVARTLSGGRRPPPSPSARGPSPPAPRTSHSSHGRQSPTESSTTSGRPLSSRGGRSRGVLPRSNSLTSSSRSAEECHSPQRLQRSNSLTADRTALPVHHHRDGARDSARDIPASTAVPLGLSDDDEDEEEGGEQLTGWETSAGPPVHGRLEIDSRPGSSRGRGREPPELFPGETSISDADDLAWAVSSRLSFTGADVLTVEEQSHEDDSLQDYCTQLKITVPEDKAGDDMGVTQRGEIGGDLQPPEVVPKPTVYTPARPTTPLHPAMAHEAPNGIRPNASGRPPTSRGRPGTARPGDPNRLDAPVIPQAMRLSFDGPPEGTKTLGEGVQVLHFSPEDSQGPTNEGEPLQEDEFVSWRCSLESALLDLSAHLAMRSATGELEGISRHDDLGILLDRLSDIIAEGRSAMEWTAWLVGPCSSLMDSETQTAVPVRQVLLEHLACCMELSSPSLLLRAGGLILRVASSSAARLSTAKAFYTVSKDNKNDAIFRTEKIVEPLVELTQIAVKQPKEVGLDTLVYVLGTLKNTSATDARNIRALAKAGAIEASCRLCVALVSLARKADRRAAATAAAAQQDGQRPQSRGSRVSTGAAQAAVQASGLLRNLAMASAQMPRFVDGGIVDASADVLSQWGESHSEVAFNVVRVAAKLSLAPQCSTAMSQHEEFTRAIVQVLASRQDERAILVRAAFVLGNLTTDSMEARVSLGAIPGATSTIIGTLVKYLDEPSAPSSKQASMRASREEVLVKVVRLLANLSMHPDLGPDIAHQPEVATCLLSLMQQHDLSEAEELVLNCTALVTNLSFYDSLTNKILRGPSLAGDGEYAIDLLRCITPLMLCDNEESVVEAARVYGNFSRIPEVREFMLETRVVEALAVLLDHPSMEVLYAVSGTLVNLTGEAAYRQALGEAGGCRGLVDVLDRCASVLVGDFDKDTTAEQQDARSSSSAGAGNIAAGGSEMSAAGRAPGLDKVAALVVVVCKAMCNICSSGKDEGPLWHEDEVATTVSILDAVVVDVKLATKEFQELQEVVTTLSQLMGGVAVIQPPLEGEESGELEPL